MRSWSSQRRSRCSARSAPVKPAPMMPMLRATALPVEAGGADMRRMLRRRVEGEHLRGRARMQRVMKGDRPGRIARSGRTFRSAEPTRDLPTRESGLGHGVQDDECENLGERKHQELLWL